MDLRVDIGNGDKVSQRRACVLAQEYPRLSQHDHRIVLSTMVVAQQMNASDHISNLQVVDFRIYHMITWFSHAMLSNY